MEKWLSLFFSLTQINAALLCGENVQLFLCIKQQRNSGVNNIINFSQQVYFNKQCSAVIYRPNDVLEDTE